MKTYVCLRAPQGANLVLSDEIDFCPYCSEPLASHPAVDAEPAVETLRLGEPSRARHFRRLADALATEWGISRDDAVFEAVRRCAENR